MDRQARASAVLREAEPYLRSPLTPLLVFVPIGLLLASAGSAAALNPLLIFAFNGLAIVPLANLISRSVDTLSDHLGDQWGGCLNATFGNLVEIVVAYAALTGGLYDVVLDGLVGAMVTNLVLVLGVATVIGGMRFTRMGISTHTSLLNSKLLLAVIMVTFIPSALHHLQLFRSSEHHSHYSLLLALALLLFYALSYVYQFHTHSHLFQADDRDGAPATTRPSRLNLVVALAVLILTTLVLRATSAGLISGLAASVQAFQLSRFFSGVFLMPLFGSAAELLISLRSAQRNRMDIAVATTVGSSIQIVLFVLPLLVVIGWAIGRPLGLFFSPQAMVAVITSVLAVQWVTDDSALDWFEGAFLVLVYLLLLASSYFLL